MSGQRRAAYLVQGIVCIICGVLAANHWHSAGLGWLFGLTLMTLSPDPASP